MLDNIAPQDEQGSVVDVRFEHYSYSKLGANESRPRISWRIANLPAGCLPKTYELELYEIPNHSCDSRLLFAGQYHSGQTTFVPWPVDEPLKSRQRVSVRVRACLNNVNATPWSEATYIEAGLLLREDWKCQRLTAPWGTSGETPLPEVLFRREFRILGSVARARLYITAQGVYEAEINGCRVGDVFLAPGWSVYSKRLLYQTYDITEILSRSTSHCIGIRVGEGWFCGRLGFAGGRRNIWGNRTSVMAQIEVHYYDGRTERICTDGSWSVAIGPIRLAELYRGEKYDATQEISGWSTVSADLPKRSSEPWTKAIILPSLPETIRLVSSFSEPVRRVMTIKPVKKIISSSGKSILDFGQNLVGYTRILSMKGPSGHKISLYHAEVLEHGELGRRPLMTADALDEYTFKGSEDETWEPRFTFHGFRYVQVDGWSPLDDPALLESLEAVVCHTDMEGPTGEFSCSEDMLNRLHENVLWSMRGNFLSIPMDCPQRDERLGWTGDMALFAPTAVLLFGCYGILKNWLVDVWLEQQEQGGLPSLTVPNVLFFHPVWGKKFPCAIWHDVTVLAPWALYEETGDVTILMQQYPSMLEWLGKIPWHSESQSPFWNTSDFQFGDWLDPTASPHEPHKGRTDPILVANAFLVHSLDIVAQVSSILGEITHQEKFRVHARRAREKFAHEYITQSGRLSSDSQSAYALTICFDLFPSEEQKLGAGNRLAEIIRRNAFKIGTGFAGTPFILEALALTNHSDIAYTMLLNQERPSWLYPISMGATTIWERWDSMLPDGTINPGRMTSFNHYVFGAVASYLYNRVAGLRRIEPGWKTSLVAPDLGGGLTRARAAHLTPFGRVACSWEIDSQSNNFHLHVCVPAHTTMKVLLPHADSTRTELVPPGNWTFSVSYRRSYKWPVEGITGLP